MKTSKDILEAHQIRDVLMQNSVPGEIILIEDKSAVLREFEEVDIPHLGQKISALPKPPAPP